MECVRTGDRAEGVAAAVPVSLRVRSLCRPAGCGGSRMSPREGDPLGSPSLSPSVSPEPGEQAVRTCSSSSARGDLVRSAGGFVRNSNAGTHVMS